MPSDRSPRSEARIFFTDRSVDFSFQEGQKGFSQEQTDYLNSRAGILPDQIFNIRQIHGNNVIVVTEEVLKEQNFVLEADGAVTDTPGIALAVRTADCLPILFFDPGIKCVGIAHAGGKGCQKGVAGNVVTALQENYGCRPQDLLVEFMAAIRICCYKVDEEFCSFFPEGVVQNSRGIYFDLALVNKRQLIERGIKEENISDCKQCTCCDERFFSYRREGAGAGRHLSLIMI